MRLLQPADFGGYEADPRDFLNAVMDIGNWCPSAGWVAGVVGVHPWELAFNDRRLQQEVWGDDPDTWIASPYAPSGTATPVDGGYVLDGRWKFSSGTDLCDWVVLGAGVPGGGTDDVPFMVHVMLPRSDYEIDPDSWQVMGLSGTGSKDVVVSGAFVPTYRTIDAVKVMDGRAAAEAARANPLYRLPWSTIFPCAIAAGLMGIAEGVLEHALEYQSGRVNAVGTAQVGDPHTRADHGRHGDREGPSHLTRGDHNTTVRRRGHHDNRVRWRCCVEVVREREVVRRQALTTIGVPTGQRL